jgi:NADPH:quinone reductase-like Zn-dependent oxidoreductase
MPQNLNYLEGSTLVCAGLTAWNGLYGLKPLMPGDYVLTQGSGGVSVFALQFAKAAGAKVIATTSSKEKAERLRKLGADHVINYKETPNWGEVAKALTPGGAGVQHVIAVGGPGTMAQSLKAIQIDGVISLIGFVASPTGEQPTFLDALSNFCTVRGLLVGSRAQFEAMVSVVMDAVWGKGDVLILSRIVRLRRTISSLLWMLRSSLSTKPRSKFSPHLHKPSYGC